MENTNKELAVQKPSYSSRFTDLVLKEFGVSAIKTPEMADFHKRLCQNYFIHIDSVLKIAEVKRLSKDEKKRDDLPMVWDNVNLQKLANDVVTYARVGLDPMQPNHINTIPFKNNKTNKYDIVFLIGYRGLEIKATKYGLDIPDQVIVDLVFKNDTFREIKKNVKNNIESYEFEVNDSFDRGELKGGFYCHVFREHPEKNRLVIFTKEEIEKRKPEYASPEFWGGLKPVYKDGKKVGTEKVEGWYKEMCYKTMYRAAFNSITIDSSKIDDGFMKLIELEAEENKRNPEAIQASTQNSMSLEEVAKQPIPNEIKPEAPEPKEAAKPEPVKKENGKTKKAEETKDIPETPNF